MANAVRPDGWLLIEEADYGSALSIDVTNPSAVIFTSTFEPCGTSFGKGDNGCIFWSSSACSYRATWIH